MGVVFSSIDICSVDIISLRLVLTPKTPLRDNLSTAHQSVAKDRISVALKGAPSLPALPYLNNLIFPTIIAYKE